MKKALNFLVLIVLLAGVATLNSCKKEEIPVVTTTAVSGVTTTTAVSGGNVTDDGGADVTARGVCWGTAANPAISGSKTTDGTGTGSFSSNLTGLTPGTTYYVRAYATNSVGTAYGNEVEFTATPIAGATVTTAAVTVVSYTTATAGGNVTATGGGTVTAKGVCYGTSANPVIGGAHTTDGTGAGSFTSSLTALASGTRYYVRAYATNDAGTVYGEQVEFTTLAVGMPDLSTGAVSSITDVSATVGGNVTADNGGAISERGICWGTSENPTVEDNSIAAALGVGTGEFTVNLAELEMGTTYYVRAYAENSAGTSYGDQVTFNTLLRDADDNLYVVVRIGSALWMAENLATTTFRNDTPIPTDFTGTEWALLTGPGYCWYDDNEARNKPLYGALYNWFAASNANLCPDGWQVPTDAQYRDLEMALGMSQTDAELRGWRGDDEGTQMKSTTGWTTSNGTNSSGFNAMPGGFRYYDGGPFFHAGDIAYFWTRDEDTVNRAMMRQLGLDADGLDHTNINRQNAMRTAGKSVRCIKTP
ncbi:MAG: fibrobacter succinogenes major paralogous domain-containing protein [Bacteroidales bacterium]